MQRRTAAEPTAPEVLVSGTDTGTCCVALLTVSGPVAVQGGTLAHIQGLGAVHSPPKSNGGVAGGGTHLSSEADSSGRGERERGKEKREKSP